MRVYSCAYTVTFIVAFSCLYPKPCIATLIGNPNRVRENPTGASGSANNWAAAAAAVAALTASGGQVWHCASSVLG